jgi:hypothetical protein
MAVVGVLIVLVGVYDGVSVIKFVIVGNGVLLGVVVAIAGVAEALVTPMITGVAVKMDGVTVETRNGVGMGRGWTTQPLQAESKRISRSAGMIFFISSPLRALYPAWRFEQSPHLVFCHYFACRQ